MSVGSPGGVLRRRVPMVEGWFGGHPMGSVNMVPCHKSARACSMCTVDGPPHAPCSTIEQNLARLPRPALTNANEWRTARLYNEECDVLLKKHQAMLKAIYSRYRLKPPHGGLRTRVVRLEGWLQLMQDARLVDKQFTLQVWRSGLLPQGSGSARCPAGHRRCEPRRLTLPPLHTAGLCAGIPVGSNGCGRRDQGLPEVRGLPQQCSQRPPPSPLSHSPLGPCQALRSVGGLRSAHDALHRRAGTRR